MSEIELHNPPTDGISSVKFNPNSSKYLLVSSWDSSVRLYNIASNQLEYSYNHELAVLDCCFYNTEKVVSGGLDNELKLCDLQTNNISTLGRHDKPIRCITYNPETNIIITGSWDQTVKLWDPRSENLVGSFSQPERVYTMDCCGDKLIVGTAGRKVLVWDLNNMGYVQQRRESSLKYQTRCLRCFPNKSGYALSSVEGRVAIEYLDPSPEIQKRKYAFKCHRTRVDDIEHVHPVNAIAFHRLFNTFATGGSDGCVNIWDGFNKKRLCQFHKYPTSISSLCFSHDGNYLAIASSYLYEVPDKPAPCPDSISIRRITEQEAKPK